MPTLTASPTQSASEPKPPKRRPPPAPHYPPRQTPTKEAGGAPAARDGQELHHPPRRSPPTTVTPAASPTTTRGTRPQGRSARQRRSPTCSGTTFPRWPPSPHDGTVYEAQYVSTDQSERTRSGNTAFHNGPVGLSAQTTAAGGHELHPLPRRRPPRLPHRRTALLLPLRESRQHRSRRRPGREQGQPVPVRTLRPPPARNARRDPSAQPDPSGQEKNPYLYAACDPTNNIDPMGTSFFSSLIHGVTKFFSSVQECIGGVGAASRTEILEYTSAAGDPVGFVWRGHILRYRNARLSQQRLRTDLRLTAWD